MYIQIKFYIVGNLWILLETWKAQLHNDDNWYCTKQLNILGVSVGSMNLQRRDKQSILCVL